MRESRPAPASAATRFESHQPVPAARPMFDFSVEWIGDDVVLFDVELNRYHTLNRIAYEIWRMCDGIRSIDVIAVQATIHRDLAEATVDQLGESGLLDASELFFESTLSRRRALRLVAAGAIGAVGIPVVASITRLGPEASASHGGVHCPSTIVCTGPDKCCCFNPNSGGFTCSDVSGSNGCSGGGKYCVPYA